MNFIKKQIEQFNTIIIHGHKTPDGDCYGSQLGLKDIIATNYPDKKVYVVGDETPKISFLGKMDQIEDDVYKDALVFIVDCGQSSIISDNRYKLGKMSIRIDHHLFVQKIADYEWIDSNFASCSEMIYYFKKFHNYKLTYKGALPIYTGIVTDTGNFRFERVNYKTFQFVVDLLKYDLNVFEIDQKINFKSVNLLKFQGYVCSNFIAEGGFIYFKFSEEILEQYNLTVEEAFSIVNVFNYIENNSVWGFILAYKNGSYKFSLRSLGPKINSIAHKFGGGGHQKACGIFVQNTDEMNEVIELIKESIKVFNSEKSQTIHTNITNK
ncbi:MAG: bifunctional oligoribonuclease/PAP phosphatase NrnA [Phytoplasma sp.]|uniref:DHH family phosphoesterase n=1 Tax=Phytoplasma sp. TaxID=2155 RepID=UPI002B400A7C|nr:bifunctional oligoribonuclease/PAP phosphatase NrnA [Phytoplasma sp.]WRH06864.1 MAG: bifunctional oligoribonuclease/PAP phosphatase NrnA [Phytoplasma sp.]